jgi:hypothetical protein
MTFNTPGHAADWRSIGSNARPGRVPAVSVTVETSIISGN